MIRLNKQIPTKTEACENHWTALFDAIRGADNSEPIYTLLSTDPIKDDIFQELEMGEDCAVKTVDRHAADRFVLYVQPGKKGKARANYLGNAERVRDEQSQTGFGYSPETTRKLRHEVGLRLSRLQGLDRRVYFTSDILDAEEREVTKEFIIGLLSSDRKELGFVETKILED